MRTLLPTQDNLSPLHVAAGMGHIEVTKRLLDNGAHMEAEDNALYTPLWRAAYYGHPEVVEVGFFTRRFESEVAMHAGIYCQQLAVHTWLVPGTSLETHVVHLSSSCDSRI